jgi:hypothetical protein
MYYTLIQLKNIFHTVSLTLLEDFSALTNWRSGCGLLKVLGLRNPVGDTKTVLTDDEGDNGGVFGTYFKLLSQNVLK